MNAARQIERAIADVLRASANLPEGTTIRCWQDLRHDATWMDSIDRSFPMVEIRSAPPRTDDNQSTLAIETAVIIGTQNQDDKDHAVIADIYGEVQAALDRLYASFRSGTPNAEFVAFANSMQEMSNAGEFNFGGFSYGTPLAPFEERNAVMIGVTLVTHYSRNDF